jgi:hypothetical protein
MKKRHSSYGDGKGKTKTRLPGGPENQSSSMETVKRVAGGKVDSGGVAKKKPGRA